jgi:hypothetical protein
LVVSPTSEKSSSTSDSSWRATLTDPAVVAVIAYAVVAIVAAIAAYLTLFTQFVPYDDEGTLLVTLKAFVHGDTLYRDVYSEYGPFYYEVFGGLFALTGHAITTDVSRSIVLVVWVLTSLLFGIAAQRLTRRLGLGIVSMIAAFAALAVLAGEPMHPQGLCVLLLGTFVLVAASEPDRRAAWAGAACGALVAALVLTKVNLGIFAIAAMVLASVWCVGSLYRRRWLRWPVIVAFLAMPLLITARDLDTGWTRELMLLEVFAMLAVLIAASPLRPQGGDDDSTLGRWLLAAVAGFTAAFAAILAAIFLTGASPADVYDGTVTQALRVRDVLVSQFPFPPAALDWAIAAVAAAFLTVRLRPGDVGRPTIWPGVLRASAGLAILLSVARIAPLGLNPSASNPDTLPMLLAWVAAIPPVGPRESAYKRYLRILLPALAIAETLQVYPVAGSQMGIASLSFVPVGALCLGDAWVSLRAWSADRGPRTLERFGAVASVAAIAVAGVFALDTLLRPAATNAIAYRDRQALPFPGATAMHLPPADVETYSRLVDLLHSHRCTAFAAYPNINSLYLWSGIESPTPQAPGAWINALDGPQQQRVVDSLRASPRPCAIRSDERAQLWLHGEPPPDRPLVRYLLDDFRPVRRVGEFEFELPVPAGSEKPIP